mmetsp:Transcript_26018/g.83532  ORF Transcript_26018/g.83532 Transcript_26018/m.83532 type:complete len:216 (-) Transcript_26018:201-848(-)
MPGSCKSSTTSTYLGGSSASCVMADSPSTCASTQKPSRSRSCCMAARAIWQSSTIRMRGRGGGSARAAAAQAQGALGLPIAPPLPSPSPRRGPPSGEPTTPGMRGATASPSVGIHFWSMCRSDGSVTGLQSASCMPEAGRSSWEAFEEQAMKTVCDMRACRSEGALEGALAREPMCSAYALASSTPERPGSRRSTRTISKTVVEQSAHASSAETA